MCPRAVHLPDPAPVARFAEPRTLAEARADGSVRLRSAAPLLEPARCVGEWLSRWGGETADQAAFAERSEGAWRILTWGEAWDRIRAVGQALLARGLGPERPVVILSGNSVDHLTLSLAAQLVGIPVVPVSVAYSLQARAYDKVMSICREVRPGLVFAEDAERFASALSAVRTVCPAAEFVGRTGGPSPQGRITPYSDLERTVAGADVDRAAATVGPDTLAKVLYTSGSTGQPKGVINTHRMLCVNQQQLVQIWPFLAEQPPVLLDWLPWNHTFGGNHNVNLVLAHGGTLYIDDGRPTPALIGRTVRNLREVRPTLSFNVPLGYGALLPWLEADDDLARGFLERLQLIFYAGASLPQDLWERLQLLAERHGRGSIPMTTSWGSTETAPLATSAHFPLQRAGNIGVPIPGVELKLVPCDGAWEVRVRGLNVTPGYFARPDLNETAFDEEGFYRIGDAVRLADPQDASRGLIFDGRVAEDFKLLSGTKVPVGQLRVHLVAVMAPYVTDAVVTGHDRAEVGLLVWLNAEASAEVKAALRLRIEGHNLEQTGSSMIVRRMMILTDPPSLEAGEITDKGYVNQRTTLERRADLVRRLYQDTPEDEVFVF